MFAIPLLLGWRTQPELIKMAVKSPVRGRDQRFVELPLVRPALVTTNQQDRAARRIERECDPPYLRFPPKPQLFHVAVLRAFEGTHGRTAKVWAELLEQFRVCKQFVLEVGIQPLEFRIKLRVKEHRPMHVELWI